MFGSADGWLRSIGYFVNAAIRRLWLINLSHRSHSLQGSTLSLEGRGRAEWRARRSVCKWHRISWCF
jgi:hypothetical protein